MINEDRSRRLLILTSDKVMKAAVEMASKGVMDATFKVGYADVKNVWF